MIYFIDADADIIFADWQPFNLSLNNYYYIDVNVTDGTMPHNAVDYEKEVPRFSTDETPSNFFLLFFDFC